MLTVELALDEFLFACEADGLAAKSVIWYGSILKPFVARFKGTKVDQVTANDIRVYIAEIRTKPSWKRGGTQEVHQPISIESLERKLF
jgi:hypothetical protein